MKDNTKNIFRVNNITDVCRQLKISGEPERENVHMDVSVLSNDFCMHNMEINYPRLAMGISIEDGDIVVRFTPLWKG